MLVDSGARDKVKPVWLGKVLVAQMEDGGWSDFIPIFPLGTFRYFGLTGHGIGRRTYESNFHTTAQGLLLMTLLNAQSPVETRPSSPQGQLILPGPDNTSRMVNKLDTRISL